MLLYFDNIQAQRIKELFDLAVQRQAKEISDNINGYGLDNHLMGLKYAAIEAGENLPELFNDESFSIIHHFALSTSQVRNVFFVFFLFYLYIYNSTMLNDNQSLNDQIVYIKYQKPPLEQPYSTGVIKSKIEGS